MLTVQHAVQLVCWDFELPAYLHVLNKASSQCFCACDFSAGALLPGMELHPPSGSIRDAGGTVQLPAALRQHGRGRGFHGAQGAVPRAAGALSCSQRWGASNVL